MLLILRANENSSEYDFLLRMLLLKDSTSEIYIVFIFHEHRFTFFSQKQGLKY